METRNIPELMRTISGKKVETEYEWRWHRREEILALFSHFVYGERPVNRPEDLEFTVLSETEAAPGILCKEVRLDFRGYNFTILLYLPENRDGKVPVFVYLMHEFQELNTNFDKILENRFIPFGELAKRQYGICIVRASQIYPDEMRNVNFDFANRLDYRTGVFTALERRAERQSHSWATLSAWAWALSRAVDYLEADPACDSAKFISCGHSRGGKTSLWCGATDKRIALAISSCSGCGGAAVTRGKKGEQIKGINTTDWFCQHYRRFNDRVDLLPVDQHMLLALMAPRAVYVSSAVEDEQADPDSEFLSCKLAGEPYELYGMQGLVTEDETPVLNKLYHEGRIAYHMHEGGHAILLSDWTHYMDFADKIFGR